MGQKDRSLSFKDLYSKLSKLNILQEEVSFFLDLFFQKKEIKFPNSKDWNKREIAFSSALLGLRKGVIAQIVKLHTKLHGEGMDGSRFPKQKAMPDIFSPGVKMSSGFGFSFNRGSPMPMTLFSSP
jgi:hypothetical protein